MLKTCNCSNYCFACVSQHSAFVDLVWSVTEEAKEFVWNLAQKKMKNELWQDQTNADQQMENAINEAVATVLFHTMTPDEIKELTN
jgi:predicted oxidoreductase (fatty acid repression mutant protein)